MTPPATETAGGALLGSPQGGTPPGYGNSDEHLWDELRRIDQYLRAQAVLWQLTVGSREPADADTREAPGAAEISAYLDSSFVASHYLPPELHEQLAPYWQEAERLEAAIAARIQRTPPEVLLRVVRLQRVLGLSDLERDIVLVCLLPDSDDRYQPLLGYLQGDPRRRWPTVGLVLQILYPRAREPGEGRFAFEATAPLRTHRLIVLAASGRDGAPLLARAVRLDDRIAAYLLGSDRLDRRLGGIVVAESRAIAPGAEAGLSALDPDTLAHLRTFAAWWQRRKQLPEARAAVLLVGPDESITRAAARAVCAAARTPLLVADVGAALASATGWPDAIALAYREALLRDAALYWGGSEALLARDQRPEGWEALIAAAERFPVLTFLASHSGWDPTGYFEDTPFLRLDFPAPEIDQRSRQWKAALPPGIGHPPDAELIQLADRFHLSSASLRNVALDATFQALADAAAGEAPDRLTITIRYLEQAIAREYRRLGKPVTQEEFGDALA